MFASPTWILEPICKVEAASSFSDGMCSMMDKLCMDARVTVEPTPRRTWSKMATGVMMPVFPTDHSTSLNTVSFVSSVHFIAMLPRGWCPVLPSPSAYSWSL